MTEIKIDDNVPMPTRPKKHPLGQLEIGQSYFVAGMPSNNVTGNFVYHRPKKFTVRTVTENGVNGVRVWRTA